MINVTIIPTGFLKIYIKAKGPITMELPDGSTVADAMTKLDLPQKLVKLVNINGLKSDFEGLLQDGDEVYLQPVVLGG